MESFENVWRLLSRWITPDDAQLWRRASYRFHALVASQWRQGRVFLAGDAAHQQPPFLGQGMCQGLRDVSNLAWKLDAVLKGQADEALLETYGQERANHVRALTSVIKKIGTYICEHDPIAAQRRDEEWHSRTLKSEPRQDLIPGLQGGFFYGSGSPAEGRLFPQPWVINLQGQSGLLDDIAGAGWRLVLDEAALGWTFQPRQEIRIIRFGSVPRAECFQERDNVVQQWFIEHRCKAAIVRPDHYVYALAQSPDQLTAQLAELKQNLVSKDIGVAC